MNDRVGQQLGNYRLLRLLGQGGFADVYLGEHIYLKTPAAIKVLQTRLAKDDLQGFLSEARAIANLVHPNIVRVLEFGVEGDTPFLVMDNAPNGTLRQRHPKGSRVLPANIAFYIKHVAAALQYAHDQKLVHRDIKPENMLVGRNNEVLLSDFGIAVVAQSSRYQSGQEVGGTIAYMAPEQLQGKAVPASDQYALGIVVYEWLTGERPFHGSFPEIASQHMLASPLSLREKIPDIPPAVEEVVQRALTKDYQQRFMRVQAFATALEHACQGWQPAASAPPRAASSPSWSSQPTYLKTPADPSVQSTYLVNPPSRPTPSPTPFPPAGPSSPNFGVTPQGQFSLPGSAFTSGQYSQTTFAQSTTPPTAPPSTGRPQSPNRGIPRRAVVAGVAGVAALAVVGGSVALFAFSQKQHGPSGASATSTSTNNNNPASTATAAPTDTSTVAPGDTSTPEASPTTAPTVATTPGTVLYTADWSGGLNGWSGTADWKVLNGELLNDGTSYNGDAQPTIVAPYIVEGITDYAAEVRIRVVRGGPAFDAATVRGTSTTDGWTGYKGTIADGQLKIQSNNDVLTQTPFDPQNNWHVYRLEAKGTRLRFYVDGGLSLETNDNRYLTGGQVGLKSYGTQLEVSSFKIVAV